MISVQIAFWYKNIEEKNKLHHIFISVAFFIATKCDFLNKKKRKKKRPDFFTQIIKKRDKKWSVVYQKKQRSKSASIKKLSDNCDETNEMPGVSWNFCCLVSRLFHLKVSFSLKSMENCIKNSYDNSKKFPQHKITFVHSWHAELCTWSAFFSTRTD